MEWGAVSEIGLPQHFCLSWQPHCSGKVLFVIAWGEYCLESGFEEECVRLGALEGVGIYEAFVWFEGLCGG